MYQSQEDAGDTASCQEVRSRDILLMLHSKASRERLEQRGTLIEISNLLWTELL